MNSFDALFHTRKPIIGMIHLLPLPGSPRWGGSMKEIEAAALADLIALTDGGADAAIIENFGDLPYDKDISIFTYAAMCTVASRICERASIPIGINVQYNCTEHEWALAAAVGADFIRVEAFVENRVGTHGVVYSAAPSLMRLKAEHPAKTLIFADINTKHTVPLQPQPIELSAHEAAESGADALIVTGILTGVNPTKEDLLMVKSAGMGLPVLLGSGINAENAASFFEAADGAIVGSSLKVGGVVSNRVERDRVKDFAAACGDSRIK